MKGKLAALAAVGALIAIAGFASTSLAKPPGDPRTDPLIGKQLYKFNALAKPGDWVEDNAVCSNRGARVFYDRNDSGGNYTLVWLADSSVTGFVITDCDGTEDGTAVISYDNDGKVAGKEVVVTLALHGPMDSVLYNFICAENLKAGLTLDDLDEPVCIIETPTNFRNKTHTKIMKNLFDDALEGVTWTWGKNSKWKVMDIRVWEWNG